MASESYLLAQLSLDAAIEVDDYILNRNLPHLKMNHDSKNIKGFVGILNSYKLGEKGALSSQPNFYLPLARAMGFGSDKKLRDTADVALEMKLLSMDLISVTELSLDKLTSLKQFLLEASREFEADYLLIPHRAA